MENYNKQHSSNKNYDDERGDGIFTVVLISVLTALSIGFVLGFTICYFLKL